MSAKQRIEASDAPSPERVSILLPVLNEAQRIAGVYLSVRTAG